MTVKAQFDLTWNMKLNLSSIGVYVNWIQKSENYELSLLSKLLRHLKFEFGKEVFMFLCTSAMFAPMIWWGMCIVYKSSGMIFSVYSFSLEIMCRFYRCLVRLRETGKIVL
jgi:hypothetical protein